jgi:hypothetical protein
MGGEGRGGEGGSGKGMCRAADAGSLVCGWVGGEGGRGEGMSFRGGRNACLVNGWVGAERGRGHGKTGMFGTLAERPGGRGGKAGGGGEGGLVRCLALLWQRRAAGSVRGTVHIGPQTRTQHVHSRDSSAAASGGACRTGNTLHQAAPLCDLQA